MKLNNILAVVAASVMLSGCFGGVRIPDIRIHRPIEIPDIQPSPMTLQTVTWQVYTVAELSEMVRQAEASGQTDVVFYVLPQDQYNALAFNLAEMRRYIEDQKAANRYLTDAIKINNGEIPAPTGPQP
jgi:hypothetical protein